MAKQSKKYKLIFGEVWMRKYSERVNSSQKEILPLKGNLFIMGKA